MEEYLKFIVQDIRGGITIIFICSILICIACLMDMWTGIDAARANKEKIRSKPLRKTGVKVLIDILGLCFPWYNLPYGAIIGTAGVLFVEGFSVVENLRRKRSHAAEVADVAAKIVKCLTTEDAEKIIKMIKEEKK